MTTWQAPGAGFYAGQQGPYPQNPGYPPPQEGYPYSQNPGYPPPYSGGNPPGPGFIPPPGVPPYGEAPPPVGPEFGGVPPGHPGMYGSGYGEDPMQDEVKGFEFSDKTIRNGFIRKVYSILMCQLIITLGMIAWLLYHKPTQLWVRSHLELFWIALALTLVLFICMVCCTNVRRKAPMNFIFLFLFTFAEAFLLSVTASTYESQEVMLAVGITAAVCLGLTIFAFQTKIDFTGLHTFLFVAVLVLLIFGMVAIIWQGKVMTLVYASLGAFIFSIYLIYDTQMMIGGKHKYSISPEEYIFAALSLYLDVINIFLYILTIIGATRD
ncbi:Glutamate [NMDA] receptor-associated protein 1 [Trachymyrmex zeteki]|uniref:Glutamate [NMDA] receptor-associated protein 1 n=1 Tax=Mycetomoellerius zeteki TaxID=64791 RepID=A0A151X1Z4_9HYME|nr:PREDICTED: protein lifeguard 1-like [Trachymyrmex zeteki]XP_018305232.1 PREDICTED: protein lifeguard 1-like [Trachymyrmex zeteki]XP_018305233.1 PREDICTED: protein lifeguard 1-like [Trachymyrmex zeteki]KYQ54286.1 Glutamate [NMDA] receptor-associated protein 1 [Trachymyrmex zeteki]